MRKLKLVEHISLDGVMQMGNDFAYGEWTAPYRTPAGAAKMMEKFGERFDLILGRKTYDLWSGFWPKAPQSPMGDRLNAATKYVVTHRPESLQWGPCEGIGPDVVASVREIKATDGPDLILSGSSSLTSAVLEHGLAEEVLFVIYPVMLGKGKRFFDDGTAPRALELVESFAMPSGVTVNSYKYEGTLKNLK